MLIVIVLTACAGWCLASMAAALVIGGAIERRDADPGCDGIRSALPTMSVRAMTPAPVVSLART